MKNRYSLRSACYRFFILFSFVCTFVPTKATTYCGTTITATDGTTTVELSCSNPSMNTYVMTLHSDDANFTGKSGDNFYCRINGDNTSTYHMTDNYTWDSSNKILTFTITSTAAPKMYTPIYLLINGEKTFTTIENQDFDWTCTSSYTLDCSAEQKFFFVNNYWHYISTPYAHMYKTGGSPTTTWNGIAMTEVDGTSGIYGIVYDNSEYNNVIFNDGSTQLSDVAIQYCNFYDNNAVAHTNMSDIAKHIYFVRNSLAAAWDPPHAYLFHYSRNNGGKAMVDMGLNNSNSEKIYSLIVPNYVNIIFKSSGDWTNQSATTYIDSSIEDYSVFNYDHNQWYELKNIYLAGTMNSWSANNSSYKFSDWDESSTTVTLNVDLDAETDYIFKLVTGTAQKYRGSNLTLTSSNTSIRLDNVNVSGNDAHITTTIAGTYTFTYDVTNAKLTVTYPALVCSGTRQHFNSTGPQINYRTNYDATSKKLQVIVESASSTMNMCNLDYRKTATGGETRVSMSIIDGVAVTTLSGFESTDEFHFRFHYSVVGTAGEYLTAEGTGNTDPGMIRMTPVSTCSNDLEDFVTAPSTVPDDPDDLNDCEIFSLFGLSSFSNKGLTEFQFWDGSPAGTREFVTIDGKNVCYVHGQPAGKYAIMSNDYDVSVYDKFHVDLWTPNTGKVRIRLMGYSGGWQEATNYKEYDATGGTWLSIDANVSDFTFANSALALAHMKGLMIINLSPSMRDYHVANMYFYKSTSDESCYADCGVDVARGKNTWAGCYENANTTSDKAVDGTTDHWQTGANANYANQWWVVDLGRCYDLDKIQITFENARTKHMRLQTRKDTPTAAQMASDAAWTTITDVSGANDDATGNILGGHAINEFDVSGNKARYIRFKSDENTHNNAYGCKIQMFKVCVTGVSIDDENPPTMVSAEYISNNVGNTGAILELHATDLEGGVSRFRLIEVGGGTTTLNTDGSNRATLEGITSGSHTYNVYAVDPAGNVSANYETLSFCFINPAENLALNKTARAGWSRTVTQANAAEVPTKANDGIGGSGTTGETEHRQWGIDANFPTKAWWAVDLGQKFKLSNVDIYWNTGDGNVPRSYIIQVANETPADFVNDAARQDLVWETVKTVTNTAQNVGSGTANRNRHSFTVANNVVARYVRIVNLDETRTAMYLREVEVYAHAIICDNNRPTMVSTELISTSGVNATIELHANDAEDGTDAVSKFRLDEVIGSTPTTTTYVSTNASHRTTLAGLTTGIHNYRVYAIDTDGNISSAYKTLTVCVCNTTENLALGKTVVAGYTPVNATEVPTQANDGNTGTHWTTYNDRPMSEHWWSVDLGEVYQLSKVQVVWQGQVFSTHYLIQVAHVAPADRSDDLLWYTVREVDEAQSGDEAVNEYSISASARYVRIKMLSRNGTYISMQEFRVFGSSCADFDNTAPVISAATVVSTNPTTGEAVIQLTATDNVTSPVNTYIVNNTTTSERAEYVANASNQITVTGLSACQTYSLQIQAKDRAANLSSVTPLAVTLSPSTSVNLALVSTPTAGFSEEGSSVNNAIDGDLSTQWQSTWATAGTNEWYTLDLGRMYDVGQMKIRWGLVAGEDDGRDYPIEYRLQISDNNYTWATFAHYNTQTPLGTWLDTTYTDPLPARYVRVWVDRHSAYSMGIREFEVYSKNACYTADGKPVITLAEITAVNPTSVDVHCESWAAGKTHDQIRYYYELTNNSTSVTTTGTKTHTSGNFTFTGLAKGVTYTARIYAEIISGAVRSLNYKEITFSVTYSSLHYLTEETVCNWTDGLNKTAWQFKYTDNYAPTELDGDGEPLQVLSYIDHSFINITPTTPPSTQYKLYEAGYGGVWTSGTNLFFRNITAGQALKMYALGTDKFVSNLDELYVSGEAVGGWWTETYNPASATAANYKMTYDSETGLFKWTGTVEPGADKYFKIVIRDIRGLTAASDTWAFDRIMSANQVYERDWTSATLYFDMKTWTWWWENAVEGCTREGGPGVRNPDNDGTAFTDGYRFDTYVQTEGGNEYLVVEAEVFDDKITNAILQFYKDATTTVSEENKQKIVTYTIGSESHTYYRFRRLLSNVPDAINGIIRYKVKFEGEAGIIRNTLYHYFDINNKVCAPDSYDIYDHNGELNSADYVTDNPSDAAYELYNYALNPHHVIGDDKALIPGDKRTGGGTVVQPVYYRRKFDPGKWYSIILPFEVDSVVVIDNGIPYKIYPKTKTANGYYWLRYYDNATAQNESGFREHWQDMAVDAGLTPQQVVPKKNVPYIIYFPKSGNYYHDKYVEFRSKGYQNFDAKNTFTPPSGVTTTGTFEYHGNTTLFKQSMGKSYYFNDWYSSYDNQGYPEQQYFVQESEHLELWPFECFVISDAETMTRVRIIGRTHNTTTTIDDILQDDAVQEKIVLYSITGQLVTQYDNMSLNEALELSQNVLQPGCYILRAASTVMKILVGGK